MTFNRINGEDVEFVDEDGNVIKGGDETLLYVNRKGRVISEKRAFKAIKSGQYVDSRQFYDERLKNKPAVLTEIDLKKKGEEQTQDLIANMYSVFAKARLETKSSNPPVNVNMIESDAARTDYASFLKQSINLSKSNHQTNHQMLSKNSSQMKLNSSNSSYQDPKKLEKTGEKRKTRTRTKQRHDEPQTLHIDESQLFNKLIGSKSKVITNNMSQHFEPHPRNNLNPQLNKPSIPKRGISSSYNSNYSNSNMIYKQVDNQMNSSLNNSVQDLQNQMQRQSLSRNKSMQPVHYHTHQQYNNNTYKQLPVQHHYALHQHYQPHVNYFDQGKYYY